jgi:ADP-ribose pyrophosphatase YjhB (NUDIX family)
LDAVERLRVYEHCPRCGAAQVTVRPPQSVECRACGFVLYVNSAAAVAAILLDPQDRVLLVRRAHEPARGKLGFPGGFVDMGESAERALRREIVEEVGLDVGPLEFLCSFPNRYPFEGVIYPTLDFFFGGRVESFDSARALDGVDGLELTPRAEVRADDLAFDSLSRAWRVFQERSPQAR